MSDHQYDIDVLNGLIAANLESADRLESLSGKAEAGSADFMALAHERRLISLTLGEAVESLGGTPDTGGSVLAKTRQALAHMQDAILGQGVIRMDSVDRGEQALEDRYHKAIEDKRLSATTRETIRRAEAMIRGEADDIHHLSQSLQSRQTEGSDLFPK